MGSTGSQTWSYILREVTLRKLGPELKKVLTECICPKCGETHNTLLAWEGSGIPRVYCLECKKLVSKINYISYIINEDAVRRVALKPSS
jgi:Zn ribbon nucleic-acid-binding protein